MGNDLSLLWVGRANIYEYKAITDPETYQTKHELVKVASDEPCRLSYSRESTAMVNQGAANLTQYTSLFIRPDLQIKAGSVIEVTQNGITEKFKRASKPAVYSRHQEISLELYEDKA